MFADAQRGTRCQERFRSPGIDEATAAPGPEHDLFYNMLLSTSGSIRAATGITQRFTVPCTCDEASLSCARGSAHATGTRSIRVLGSVDVS
jgi:hypothetical protein